MAHYFKIIIILLALMWGGFQKNAKDNVETNNIDSPLAAPDTLLSKQQLVMLDEYFTFMIANDLGRNGYFDQQIIAEVMGKAANISGAGFVAALGDVHHSMGVQSVNNPLRLSNFELMIP